MQNKKKKRNGYAPKPCHHHIFTQHLILPATSSSSFWLCRCSALADYSTRSWSQSKPRNMLRMWWRKSSFFSATTFNGRQNTLLVVAKFPRRRNSSGVVGKNALNIEENFIYPMQQLFLHICGGLEKWANKVKIAYLKNLLRKGYKQHCFYYGDGDELRSTKNIQSPCLLSEMGIG